MKRPDEVVNIYRRHINKAEKIRLLEDCILDMNNEMAAVDQNMRPEVNDRLAEGLQLATNFLRKLHEIH